MIQKLEGLSPLFLMSMWFLEENKVKAYLHLGPWILGILFCGASRLLAQRSHVSLLHYPMAMGCQEVNSIVSLGLVASLLTQRRKVGLEFGTVENMGVTLGQTLQAGPQSLSAICLRQQQGHVKPPWWDMVVD